MAPIQSRITDLTEEASQLELTCDVALSPMVASWLDSSEFLGEHDIKDYDKLARIFLNVQNHTWASTPVFCRRHSAITSQPFSAVSRFSFSTTLPTMIPRTR